MAAIFAMERRTAPFYHFMFLFLACFNWTSTFAYGLFEQKALEGRKLEIEKKYE
jgi:hypothetical protein